MLTRFRGFIMSFSGQRSSNQGNDQEDDQIDHILDGCWLIIGAQIQEEPVSNHTKESGEHGRSALPDSRGKRNKRQEQNAEPGYAKQRINQFSSDKRDCRCDQCSDEVTSERSLIFSTRRRHGVTHWHRCPLA